MAGNPRRFGAMMNRMRLPAVRPQAFTISEEDKKGAIRRPSIIATGDPASS